MKKVIVFCFLVAFLATVALVCANAADIAIEESRPAVTNAREGDIIIHTATEQAIVVMRKGYMVGEEFIPVSEDTYIFMNREDNLETEEDESSTEYTQFMNAVVDKAKLRTAILLKMGE